MHDTEEDESRAVEVHLSLRTLRWGVAVNRDGTADALREVQESLLEQTEERTMKSLNRTELDALLAVARQHSEQDYLMLLVTFSHGLRVSETLSLTRANLGERSPRCAKTEGQQQDLSAATQR